MHRLITSLLAAFVLPAAALASPPPVSGNLLSNPGFENGLAGWITDGNALLDDSLARSGDFSAGGMQDNYVQRHFQPIPVSLVGELSFWARRAGGPVDNVVFYYSDNSSSLGLANGLGRGDDWIRFDLTSQLAPGKSLTGFRVIGPTPGPAHFDDFTLTAYLAAPVPEPATFTLLLAGVGVFSMARLRRRRDD